MPTPRKVAWDGRLEAFKGRDTAHYIESVKATASRCAACRLPLGPGAAPVRYGLPAAGVLSTVPMPTSWRTIHGPFCETGHKGTEAFGAAASDRPPVGFS